MDGILIIDKPAGITSHDVVARVRRILKTKKVGHTGTLDPFATGVMVVVVGKATRLAQFLDKDEKEYRAVMKLGFETDTGDGTGRPRIAERARQSEEVAEVLATADPAKILDGYRGEIEQVPPMYSAKKVEGKKLYELARRGEEVERRAVTVTISKLELLSRPAEDEIESVVACSAGTYVRVLAEDIGRRLGVGAHLTELQRTRAGRFSLSRAVTLDELAEESDPASCLLPMESAVEHLASVSLNADRSAKTRGGLSTRIHDAQFADGQTIRILDEKGSLIAIGVYDEAEISVRPKVVLV